MKLKIINLIIAFLQKFIDDSVNDDSREITLLMQGMEEASAIIGKAGSDEFFTGDSEDLRRIRNWLFNHWGGALRRNGYPVSPGGSLDKWVSFFFESNQFFQDIEDMDGWKRLREAYPDYSDEKLLSAKEATYKGTKDPKLMKEYPNYGFRIEHDGEKTLKDFFEENGMQIK